MFFQFGPFRIDAARFELKRDGRVVKLQPKAFQILLLLINRRDRVVTKDELFAECWPGRVVGDAALNTAIKAIRQALDDSGLRQQWIHTVHKHGYRFVGVLDEAPSAFGVPDPAAPSGNGHGLHDAQAAAVADLHTGTSAGLAEGSGTGPGAAADAPAGAGPTDRSRTNPAGAEPALHATDTAGAAGAAAPVEPPAAASAPAAYAREFKHVSVLCCALPDATERAERDGPEAMDTLMRAFFAQADAVIARYGGTVLQRLDDGCTALFGAPQAQEDHARRAVLAGLELVRTLSAGDGTATHPPIAAAGVHSGPVVVGSLPAEPGRLYVATSETVRLARCLLYQAAPGELLVSEVVGAPLRHEMHIERVPDRGLPALRVLGVAALRTGVPLNEARFATAFVGRERELGLLHERLADVRERRGQVVALVGEPGIGKSRLLREFRRTLTGVPQVEAHCLPYAAGTPYRPVAELLQRLCGVAAGDPPATVALRLRDLLLRAGINAADAAAVLGIWLDLPADTQALAHLSPQAQRERGLDLLCEVVLHAHRDPGTGDAGHAVIVLEDLHWIDSASEDWLARLALRLAGAPVLLALSFRPEYRPRWLELPWVTRLVLPPLTRHASLNLMRSAAPAERLTDALAADIAARAAGNPFFLEELSRSLDASGSAPALPDTVQALLASRIDRLAAPDKQLLQMAAVIGTPVPLALWQALSGYTPQALQAALDRLQLAGFLFEVRTENGRACVFKHALTQEVAYRSLLQSARQQLHERTAQLLSSEFTPSVAGQPELLARHYLEAGLLREAAEHWQRASRRAYERSENAQAVQHALEGLKALTPLGDDPHRKSIELRLQLTLGAALMASRGYADAQVQRAWERARVLCAPSEDPDSLFKALTGLWNYHWVRGQTAQAVTNARRLLGLAEPDGGPVRLLRAHAAMGETLFHRGEPAVAIEHLEAGAAAGRALQQPTLASMASSVTCESYCAWTLWHLGDPAQALQRAERALALARELRHPLSLAIALALKAGLHQFARDAPAALALASEAAELCHVQGFPFWEGTALVELGWAQAREGQPGVGLATMKRGITIFRATGAHIQLSSWYLLMADAQACDGRLEQAEATLAQALAWAERTGERYCEAEIHRLHGLLQRRLGDPATAERHYRKALEVARAQQAGSPELRAAVELADMYCDIGQRGQARELLAPWRDGVGDERISAELRRARAMLTELT